ncbi:hypothetical protein PAMP_002066 [Pampus punctatissimus]
MESTGVMGNIQIGTDHVPFPPHTLTLQGFWAASLNCGHRSPLYKILPCEDTGRTEPCSDSVSNEEEDLEVDQ